MFEYATRPVQLDTSQKHCSESNVEHQKPLNDNWTSFNGLEELLQRSSSSDSGVVIYRPGSGLNDSIRLQYRSLLRSSQDRARRLSSHFPSEQSRILLLHFDNHRDNVEWFWAAVLAGYLPALSTPFSADQHQRQSHVKHLKSLLSDPLVLTSEALLKQFGSSSDLRLFTIEQLQAVQPKGTKNAATTLSLSPKLPYIDGDDRLRTVTLMLTSGSSGKAKAVPLSIHQLTSSIYGKSTDWQTSSRSVFLNWIGFEHVANLSEIHLHAMALCSDQIHVQAQDLIQDPLLFLHLIHRHRVSHTFAPNFFLAMLERRIARATESELFDIDLSCLESIMSGGEANVVTTANMLASHLYSLGVRKQVIRIGYGLTESSAALIYGVLDSTYEEREKHEFASIGKPIVGAQARIMAPNGAATAPYEVGSLQLSGPMVFNHYYNNDQATKEAFTADGWFQTGDRAFIDSSGKLNLAGRSKELLNINGVKYSPVELETAVERANIEGLVPSYTAVFSHRLPGSQTEGYVVIYGVTDDQISQSRNQKAFLISKLLSSIIGVRPLKVVGLPISLLDKSSLGKLSRAKLQTRYSQGAYHKYQTDVIEAMRSVLKPKDSAKVLTKTTIAIVEVLGEMLDLPADLISTDSHVFELGLTSISLFRFEQAIRRRLDLPATISVITMLSNPIIEAIATAIDNSQSREYEPVVKLQTRGNKSPLWLVHPASGNVLAFLPLSRVITDRPLYALTARGLGNGERLFASIDEMSDTYYKHVKATQPKGPYALTGYSLGTTVAFELAKRLEANGDEVAFCAALDSPPHVIPLVEGLDWTAAAVLVSYFIELISQEEVPGLRASLAGLNKTETIERLLEVARPIQRERLRLDAQQLLAIVNVTDNFGAMAKSYHPSGSVRRIDVFFCTPLHNVERDREAWIRDHLNRWQDFSTQTIEFHECDGDHADMLNPTYVEGFKHRLDSVLAARGL